MGSRSTNISSTSYNNTPQTVSENAVALASGSFLVNRTGGVNDSSNKTITARDINTNNLDGGAIASAFGFGAEVVKGLFAAQKESNALISNTNSAANGLINKSQELVDKKENLPANALIQGSKTLWILGAVVAVYFLAKGRIK
ncbi:MAG: hypothetical protein V4605_08860 [Pseudomonadota bacterium]